MDIARLTGFAAGALPGIMEPAAVDTGHYPPCTGHHGAETGGSSARTAASALSRRGRQTLSTAPGKRLEESRAKLGAHRAVDEEVGGVAQQDE